MTYARGEHQCHMPAAHPMESKDMKFNTKREKMERGELLSKNDCVTTAQTKVRKENMDCKQMTAIAKTQSQQNRKQLVVMLVGIIILFFLCLLPFRIIALWETFSPNEGMLQVGAESYLNIIYFCRLLVYVNSAGNPIIYNIVSTKFRRAFQRVLRLYCCCWEKKVLLKRSTTNGTYSQGTRMSTLSNYTVVRQENLDHPASGHAV